MDLNYFAHNFFLLRKIDLIVGSLERESQDAQNIYPEPPLLKLAYKKVI